MIASWVVGVILILLTIGLLGATAFVLVSRNDRRKLADSNTKKALVPNKAYEEAGICQCGDALCYHAAGTLCGIEGCPCKQYIPSDASKDLLEEVGSATFSKIALAAVNMQMELAQKSRQLEVAQQAADRARDQYIDRTHR